MQIMNKDTVAAEYINSKLRIADEQKLPLFLRFRSDVTAWLETRAIDGHRANSRLLKKALRLAEHDDISAVLHVNADMALISRGYPKVTPEKDVMISEFLNLIKARPEYKEYIPALDEEMINRVSEKLNMRVRRQFITDFVMGRYNYIINKFKLI